MKSHYFLAVILNIIPCIAQGQDQQRKVGDSLREEDALKIPSSVFIPPPPPKKVPPMNVQASTVCAMPTHKILILRGDASQLPDIPPPTPEKVTVSSREGVSMPMLSLGATVYDRRLSLLHWTDQRSKVSYEAYCAWDCSLLAPCSQLKINDQLYHFSIFPSLIDSSKLRAASKTSTVQLPQLAENTYAIVKGDSASQEALQILAALRELYVNNKDLLVLIQKAKEEHQIAADAWHKANPPEPQSHTFWLKPHRGSRYLKQEGGR